MSYAREKRKDICYIAYNSRRLVFSLLSLSLPSINLSFRFPCRGRHVREERDVMLYKYSITPRLLAGVLCRHEKSRRPAGQTDGQQASRPDGRPDGQTDGQQASRPAGQTDGQTKKGLTWNAMSGLGVWVVDCAESIRTLCQSKSQTLLLDVPSPRTIESAGYAAGTLLCHRGTVANVPRSPFWMTFYRLCSIISRQCAARHAGPTHGQTMLSNRQSGHASGHCHPVWPVSDFCAVGDGISKLNSPQFQSFCKSLETQKTNAINSQSQ